MGLQPIPNRAAASYAATRGVDARVDHDVDAPSERGFISLDFIPVPSWSVLAAGGSGTLRGSPRIGMNLTGAGVASWSSCSQLGHGAGPSSKTCLNACSTVARTCSLARSSPCNTASPMPCKSVCSYLPLQCTIANRSASESSVLSPGNKPLSLPNWPIPSVTIFCSVAAVGRSRPPLRASAIPSDSNSFSSSSWPSWLRMRSE